MSEASGDRATQSRQSEFIDIDAQIKVAELEIKKAEAAKIKAEIRRGINWNIVGPLLVGIVAAVPATYGVWQNGRAQTENARAQTDNEVLTARTTLFIEAVKSGSQEPEQRKERVKFFLNTGLLSDPD